MIRVLQVLQNLDMGGAETYVMNIYRNIDRSKVQFDFAVQHRGGCYEKEIREMGGEIYYLPHFKFYNARKFELALIALLKEHPEIVVVHSHNNSVGAFAMRATYKQGLHTTISHAHTNKKCISNWKGIIYNCINPYTRYLFKKYAGYRFACSREAGRWQYGKHTDYEVINNAIDLQRFRYDEFKQTELKKKNGFKNGIIIGHVGRLEKVKNQRFLLNIFHEIHQENNDSLLIIAGEGKEKNRLATQAAELGISEAVMFVGNKNNIEEIYMMIDVFVLPSLYEGFPMTLIEAQASGLQCVVSDRISKEVDVTGNVTFLPLNAGLDKWIKTIKEKASESRQVIEGDMDEYNIKRITEKLQGFYSNLSK